MNTPETYNIVSFPKLRHFAIDAGVRGRRKHIVHGLLEVDVTQARQYLREHQAQTGESLSFTAFVITCLGKAVEMNKMVQACRTWRNQLILLLPGFVRQIFYWAINQNPHWMRTYSNRVLVTAVGMFGEGTAWGIPMASFPLTVTLGSMAKKPGVVDGRIEIREYLCVTISFDHDIVDGAPAARFTQQFKELIERGYGLCAQDFAGGHNV